MADYIALATLAKTLNDALNSISNTLKTSGDIEREIPFSIVDDIQYYEEDKVYGESVKVPGIMVSLDGDIAPSQTYQSYTENTLVTFYAFTRELDDMRKILDTYIANNVGKFTKLDNWIYQLDIKRPRVLESTPDEGEERVPILLEINHVFIYKGFTSDDISITINGEEVPVLSYTHSLSKTTKSNDTLADIGKVKHFPTDGTITKVIRFVHINNTEINKVQADIDSGENLTRSYTVGYSLSDVYSNTETMVITEGDIAFTEGGFQTISVTFKLLQDLS